MIKINLTIDEQNNVGVDLVIPEPKNEEHKTELVRITGSAICSVVAFNYLPRLQEKLRKINDDISQEVANFILLYIQVVSINNKNNSDPDLPMVNPMQVFSQGQ